MVSVTDREVIKRLVVLIADGKSYSRSLLRSMLLQLDVKKTHEAMDGVAAIEAIIAVNPDVLILDWELPILSAPDVLRMVQSPGEVPNPALPIIVISSSGQSTHVHEAIKLGARQFMVRPISLKMLQRRLLTIVIHARKVARAHKNSSQSPGLGLSPDASMSTILP